MITSIDRSKSEVLKQALKADFPALNERDLNSDNLQNLISSISQTTHQDEKAVAALIEKKLEYINSKSI